MIFNKNTNLVSLNSYKNSLKLSLEKTNTKGLEDNLILILIPLKNSMEKMEYNLS